MRQPNQNVFGYYNQQDAQDESLSQAIDSQAPETSNKGVQPCPAGRW